MPLSLNLNFARRSGADVVGLDIQPGLVAAVRARVNGSVLARRAAVSPLGSDVVREGEVIDEGALSDALRELFAKNPLSKRVRVGVANARTVMRTLELPPVTDRKELAAAVSFQAQDQVPMPLSNAVLDFHPLGIVDTPAGPRQRVLLVAAQRDMIERLLASVRQAGLHPVGIDLSAFALIRSLYRPDTEHEGRVLYLNVDGLTNLAIAEDTICRFTRVVGGGLEGMAAELAERRGIPLTDARELLVAFDLRAPAAAGAAEHLAGELTVPEPGSELDELLELGGEHEHDAPAQSEEFAWNTPDVTSTPAEHDAYEAGMSFSEMTAPEQGVTPEHGSAPHQAPAPSADVSDEEVRAVLEHGIHAISGEVRNSLEFHRSQEGGGEVARVVLSGSALDVRGFAEALQTALAIEVHAETVGVLDESLGGVVSTNRLAVAAGLASTEVHQ